MQFKRTFVSPKIKGDPLIHKKRIDMKKHSLVLMLVFASVATLMAQRTITGTVVDETGDALIGAAILIKGTNTGTITDLDGSYSLTVPDGDQILIFSYTGYSTEEIPVGVSNIIDVRLQTSATLLNEIVVTGYSEVERKKLIASVAVVDEEKINNLPLPDANQVLQGQAPGVFVTAPSGQPGAQQDIRIRGTGSITAGRGPLYVIDGIIMDQGDFTTNTNTNDILSNLNPNDIANITVLKDAAATALYGSRGANGVVLITTKRGKAGKTNITLKGQFGTILPNTGNFEMMNAEEAWGYEREMLANSGFTPEEIEDARPASMLDNTTDWVDAAFRNGRTTNLEAQASGGNEKTRFFLSGGYFQQDGTLIESDFSRLSLRSNIDHTASDVIDFSLNLNGSYTNNLNAVAGNRFALPLLGAFVNTPLQGAYNPETGELYTGLENDWAIFTNDNFLYSQPLNPVRNRNFRLISKGTVGINILDNLRFTQAANIDFITIRESLFFDPSTNDGVDENGRVTEAYNEATTLTSQSLLKYYQTFGTNHNFDALVGFEYQKANRTNFETSGRGLASGKLKTLNSTASPDFATGFNTAYSFVSVLGQINYDFSERYFLTASIRSDGSSRFGANNRWATFWSIGASWFLTEEAWFNSSFINTLRLRASYGTSGNADIGNFVWQELYSFGAAYAGNPGSTPTQIANPDLTWEKNNNFNLGLDFGFWNNRLGGTIEVYRREAYDLLLDVPVSSTSGFTTATQNIGRLENQGLELTLFGAPVRSDATGGFNWNIDMNFSMNRNKIVELPGGEDILNGNQIYREGEPIRSLFMEVYAGVDPQTGTPRWETEEGETTGTYSQADRQIVGNAEPNWMAGTTNTFTFKGFGLSAFLYTVQGHDIYNNSRRFIESDGQRYGWNHIRSALDHWKQPGDVSSRPQPLVGGNNNANARSTRYVEDASFWRLRNVTLSYNFPRSFMDNIGLQNIMIYVQGQNLWTATDYSGFDPEMDENGEEFFRYPVGKAITFGLDVTF